MHVQQDETANVGDFLLLWTIERRRTKVAQRQGAVAGRGKNDAGIST